MIVPMLACFWFYVTSKNEMRSRFLRMDRFQHVETSGRKDTQDHANARNDDKERFEIKSSLKIVKYSREAGKSHDRQQIEE